MRKLVASFIIGIAVACFSSVANAQGDWVYVTVDFEQFADDIGENSAWGGRVNDIDYIHPFDSSCPGFDDYQDLGWVAGPYGTYMPSCLYTVDGVTFTHAGIGDTGFDGMGFWWGTGLSTATEGYNTSYYQDGGWFTNEMAALTGSGNDGSQVYGVVYGESSVGLPYNDDMLPYITFEPDVELVSMAMSITSYTWFSITYGDWLATSGGEMYVVIHGIDADGGYVGTVRQTLAGFDDDGNYFVLSDWTTVDLSSLVGATELRFAFESDVAVYGSWLDYPVYFAFDDITYRYWDENAIPVTPATLDIDGDEEINDRDVDLLLLYTGGISSSNPVWNTLLRRSEGTRTTGEDVITYLTQNISIFDLDGDEEVNDRDVDLLLLYTGGISSDNPVWNTLLRRSEGTRKTGAAVIAYIESLLP